MPNRSMKDERQGVRSFGAPMGPAAAAVGVDRPRVTASDPSAVRRAISAAGNGSRSASPAPVARPPGGTSPTLSNYGGQLRRRAIDKVVDE